MRFLARGVGTAEPRSTLPGELAALAPDVPAGGRRTLRDWVVDLVLFGSAVAFWLNELSNFPPPHVDDQPGWFLTLDPWLGALACLSLWWRRRFPLALVWILLPCFVISGTTTGAAVVIVFTVAVHRNWLAATVATAPYVFLAAWYGLAFPDPELSRAASVLITSLLFVLPLGWGIAIRSRRQLLVTLSRNAERERRDHEQRLGEARRVERERIAREMHDVLAHRISLLSMHAGALAYRTARARSGAGPSPDASEVDDAVAVIRENANVALVELSDVLNVLRWTEPEQGSAPQPQLTAIPALVSEARSAGQRVVFEPGDVLAAADTIRPQAQRTAYRLVQEGLTNARKHAPGAAVTVRIDGEPGTGLTVSISNPTNGDGPSGAAPGAEVGLTGLAERVALDGGTLEHGMRSGRFELHARLPWPHEHAADRTGPGAAR